MRKKLRIGIIIAILLLLVCLGCFLIGYKVGNGAKDKCAVAPEKKEEPTKEEEKEEPKEEKDERTAKELVTPFLSAIELCDAKGTYYLKDITRYEDLSGSKAIEIALNNYTYEEWKKIYEAEKIEHEFDPENPVEDEFPDIETSYIKEKIAYTFGKDKTIKFPKKLDFWDESYTLKGDKYILEAQGGGCTLFFDYIETKVLEGIKNNDEYVIQVNFVYVTYDVKEGEHFEDADDAPVVVYNNLNKKRVVAKDFKYGDQEKQLDKILNSDKTDYMLFTFKLEDDHYIFDKVEVVER